MKRRLWLSALAVPLIAAGTLSGVRSVHAVESDEDVIVFSGTGQMDGVGLVGPGTGSDVLFNGNNLCTWVSEDNDAEPNPGQICTVNTPAPPATTAPFANVICGTGVASTSFLATMSPNALGNDPNYLVNTYTFAVVDWIGVLLGPPPANPSTATFIPFFGVGALVPATTCGNNILGGSTNQVKFSINAVVELALALNL